MQQDPFRPVQGEYERIPWRDTDVRRERLFRQFQALLRSRLEALETSREQRWQRDYSSPEAYERSIAPHRQRFLRFLTSWDEPRCDLQPRVEFLRDYPAFRLQRVWLQVRPGLEMDCLLLTPHGARREAAVVCQHGMNGTPEEAVGLAPVEGQDLYNRCGIRLAEAGFVVIAPHEVGGFGTEHPGAHYVGGWPEQPWYGARNVLHRHAVLMGLNLMGLELYHVSRAVDYLCTLDSVDPDRIGFYGLSQGGQSALWYPAADTRIKASVCAAFFNHRLPKLITSGGERYRAYIDTAEEDRFYWGQLLEFSDWQIASLICPRAFMVEAGRQDGAVWWEMAQEEFGRVQAVYERLGLGDRAAFCLHDGGHINRAIESLDFLDRWVRSWPESSRPVKPPATRTGE